MFAKATNLFLCVVTHHNSRCTENCACPIAQDPVKHNEEHIESMSTESMGVSSELSLAAVSGPSDAPVIQESTPLDISEQYIPVTPERPEVSSTQQYFPVTPEYAVVVDTQPCSPSAPESVEVVSTQQYLPVTPEFSEVANIQQILPPAPKSAEVVDTQQYLPVTPEAAEIVNTQQYSLVTPDAPEVVNEQLYLPPEPLEQPQFEDESCQNQIDKEIVSKVEVNLSDTKAMTMPSEDLSNLSEEVPSVKFKIGEFEEPTVEEKVVPALTVESKGIYIIRVK